MFLRINLENHLASYLVSGLSVPINEACSGRLYVLLGVLLRLCVGVFT